VLRRDEMYNDYLLKHGIGDVLGVRLLESATHTVMLGLHQGTHQAPFAVDRVAALQELSEMRQGSPAAHRAERPRLAILPDAAGARSCRRRGHHHRQRRAGD
jgi:hypothetical protein